MTDTNEIHSIKDLILKNEELEAQIDFLQRQNRALKMRCSSYSLRISDLESEIKDMKFTRKYLPSDEAGRRSAQELFGGA